MEPLPLLNSLGDRWGVEITAYLLNKHKNVVTNEEHLIFYKEGPLTDAYWTKRVCRFISHKDWKRSWDELEKARKGLLIAGITREGMPMDKWLQVTRSLRNRCWFATADTIGQLTLEIFEEMVKAGELSELTDDDHIFENDREGITVYETKQPRGKFSSSPPRSYGQWTTVPGFDYARNFFDREKMVWDKWGYRESSYHFTRTGAAYLTLAKYWRDKKNAKRREKHEQALTEYEKRHRRGRSAR